MRTKSILLVDDDAAAAASVRARLHSSGEFRVHIVRNADGALKCLAAASSCLSTAGACRSRGASGADRLRRPDRRAPGWVEANGQLLDASRYQELYRRIGRTWTAKGVASDRFAVPKLDDATQWRRSSDNPFGVLGPGDLVSSGRARPVTSRRSPLSYWIFAGMPAAADAPAASRRPQ